MQAFLPCSGCGQPQRGAQRVLRGDFSGRLQRWISSARHFSVPRRRDDTANIIGAAVEELSLASTPLDLAELDGTLQTASSHSVETVTPTQAMNRRLKALLSLPDLCQFIMAEADSFNAINLSHAFSRLAKMSGPNPGTVPSAFSEVPGLGPEMLASLEHACDRECVRSRTALKLSAIRRLNDQLPRLINDFEPWDVALCLWSMSILGYVDRSAFNALCHRGSQVAVVMKTADCAMIMLAFGRFNHMQPELLKYIPQIMLKELDQASPADVSAVLWGFAKLGLHSSIPGKPFMEAISDHMLWTMNHYGCQELVMVLWSMAAMEYRPEKKLLRSAERRLLELADRMNSQDASNALWAFGRMRFKAKKLLDDLPQHIMQRLGSFRPQEIACMLYGYAQARHYHSSLLEAAVPVITSKASRMSYQDITIALWAYGILSSNSLLQGPAPAATNSDPLMSAQSSPASSLSQSQPLSDEACTSASRQNQRAAETHVASFSECVGQESQDSDRASSSLGASSSQRADEPHTMACALIEALRLRDIQTFPPRALCNIVKALANLRVSSPAAHDLLDQIAKVATTRVAEFRDDEMATLLYGLSLRRYTNLQVYHACVVQLLKLLETSSLQSHIGHSHKVLNSVIHSCVSVGYLPSMLIDSAEIRGIRTRGSPTQLTPRWQTGPQGLSRPSATRHSSQPLHQLAPQQRHRHNQQQQRQRTKHRHLAVEPDPGHLQNMPDDPGTGRGHKDFRTGPRNAHPINLGPTDGTPVQTAGEGLTAAHMGLELPCIPRDSQRQYSSTSPVVRTSLLRPPARDRVRKGQVQGVELQQFKPCPVRIQGLDITEAPAWDVRAV